MNPSDNLSAIEKATEGVTPGPWHAAPGTTTGQIVVAPNTTKAKRRVAAIGGPDRDANAAYIAACSPDRMREVLALARKAEALEREIAELRKTVAYCSDALSAFADSVFNDNGDMTVNLGLATGDDYVRAYFADRRARTLLNGGSDAQG